MTRRGWTVATMALSLIAFIAGLTIDFAWIGDWTK